ncbi:hypothetical protein HPO96_06235 [Kribbella sandramycini]|uniref:Dienelactone hydrolase n=1 Tax=Kribbella sandramycini TaxID=60450 RepID=A0A7Y4KXJ3_9ACTN|nr:hypothetical protein [Kribbella sandramycini]MBB6567559.1 dienelactone hydrolase [Kribbella sandramycini]NOL39837.1 hypothetical protein [Kribbella sandramycini]
MTTIGRRTLLTVVAGSLAATTLPAAATPLPTKLVLPAPTGAYAIGVREVHLVDNSRPDPWRPERRRELMVSIWYPARPGGGARVPYAPSQVAKPLADELGTYLGLAPGRVDYAGTPTHARAGAVAIGRHPVLLYSPGFGTSRLLGTAQVEELTSRGYVVVTIDHTGEAPVEFPGGRVVPVQLPTDELRPVLDVRLADIRFVLNGLGRLPFAGSMDLRRIGMFGYSLGGFAAAETMRTDRRVAVGVNLDGAMQYGFPVGELSEVAKRGLDRPFLLFGAAEHSRLPITGDLNDPSWTSFWANQRGWKLNLSIPAGAHGSFADYQVFAPKLAKIHDLEPKPVADLVGLVNPAQSVAAQRAYLAAAFDQFLKHRPQPLLRKESPRFPIVKFV